MKSNEYRMVVSVLVVYPHDYVADWELWVATAAQNHKGLSYHILSAWEKIKIQNLKYGFYRRHYHFHNILRLQNQSLKHCKSGAVYIGFVATPLYINF